jgi:hypothetical protein
MAVLPVSFKSTIYSCKKGYEIGGVIQGHALAEQISSAYVSGEIITIIPLGANHRGCPRLRHIRAVMITIKSAWGGKYKLAELVFLRGSFPVKSGKMALRHWHGDALIA